MSQPRKNARRLRDLRRRGLPIARDYRVLVSGKGLGVLEDELGHRPRVESPEDPEGGAHLVYLDPTEQRDLLVSLGERGKGLR